MPPTACRRCGEPLTPIYPDQTEHPLCSPAPTGWIPPGGEHHRLTLQLALAHARRGWHVLPLSADSKRPLGNCRASVDMAQWRRAGNSGTGWAGHSVEVLLRIYAKCLVGQHEIAKRRISEALRQT